MNRLQLRTAIKGILDDLVGADSEQYWDKATINAFIQEAMEEIAKRTLCIKDSLTAEYCLIPLQSGVIHYSIPSRVLNILSVRKSWDGRELAQTNHQDISASSPLWATSTMEPIKYLTDFSMGFISIVGKIETVTDHSLNMSVNRLPAIMTADTDIPEVPENIHNMSLDWVLYRCFSKQDSEIFSKSMAQDYLSRFEGPQSQLGKGGNIQQILLQLRPFYTKTKVRYC